MKRTAICIAMALTLLACKDKGSDSTSNTTTTNETSTVSESPAAPKTDTIQNASFDINSIPVTDKDPGNFPYLQPPATYKYGYGDDKEVKQSDIKDVDKEYFAINGKLIPMEGKTYKVAIEKNRADGKRFNTLEVDRSYNKAILAMGGVQVNNVPVTQAEYDRVGNKELIEKHYGASINANLLNDIKTYVIRTKDKEIWIQMTLLNEESGNLTVLEKAK